MRERGIEEEEGLTRRSFLKGALVTGTAGVLGAAAFGTVRSLIAPEFLAVGDLVPGFIYLRGEAAVIPQWYQEEGLVGEEARLAHFSPERGAPTLWLAVRDEEDRIVPGTGFPVLLIQWHDDELEWPEDSGYDRDEFVIDGLYALFNCCPHACCRPGWRVIPRGTSPYRDDLGFDNIFCACHFSQYNPRRLSVYRHPGPPESTGARYVGVHKDVPGPADRGMPLIPLELDGDRPIGVPRNPEWYHYLDFKGRRFPDPEEVL